MALHQALQEPGAGPTPEQGAEYRVPNVQPRALVEGGRAINFTIQSPSILNHHS